MKASRSCRTLAAAIAAVMMMAVGAVAQTWECGATPGTVTATLSGGTLTVSGTGAMSGGAPWSDYKDSITSIVIGNGVTSIGAYTFNECKNLTSVTIPNSVTSIIAGAFDACSSLTSVTIPNSVDSIDYMAFGRTGLTSVAIPASVTWINAYAFSGANLTSVTLPTGVAFMGFGVFSHCKNLTSVTIPNGLDSIATGTFYGCSKLTSVTIPNSVTVIGDVAFQECTGLTSIEVGAGNAVYSSVNGVLFNKAKDTLVRYPSGKQGAYIIPNSVTSIKDYAFDYSAGLTSVTIQYGVTSIGNGVFVSCSSLTSVTIPNSVISIGYNAFNNCTGLTSVTIPNSTTEIMDAHTVFDECASLTNIDVGKGNTVYSSIDGVLFNKAQDTLLVYPRNKQGAYTIPNSTFFERNTFVKCTGLTSVTIPDDMDSIWYQAFWGCTGLTSVTIPSNVEFIGERAFYGCTSLKSVISLNDVPPVIHWNQYTGQMTPFDGVDVASACLYVPAIAFYVYSVYNGWEQFGCIRDTASLRDSTIWAQWDCGKVAGAVMATLKFDSTLTISGAGDIADYDRNNAPWLLSNFGNTVTDVVIENGVTSIGDYALYALLNMTSVTIPNSVTSIGEAAFWACTSLTSVTIPNSVTSIGADAFSSTALTSVTIPNSVTSSIDWMFSDCRSLTSVTIGNSVTSIGEYAFAGCTKLTSVTIGNSVTSIKQTAFAYCGSLKTVINLGEVPVAFDDNNWIFYVPTDSAALYVPKSSIAAYSSANVWKRFGSIKAVDEWDCGAVPGTVTAKLDEDGTLTISGEGDMKDYDGFFGFPWYDFHNSIKSIVIEDGVTSIERFAFWGYTNVTPDRYPNLTSVTISNSVTVIRASAFAGCVNLTSVTIGSGVASIGDGAFDRCTSLKSVRVLSEAPPVISETAFYRVSLDSVTLYVPQSAVGAYLAADDGVWAGFGYINPSDVTFESQGGTAVASRKVSYGGKLAAPEAPVRSGYTFDGWYKEPEHTTPWDFAEEEVTSDVTLYAKWAKSVSVLTPDRAIPQTKPKEEATVIAPVSQLTGEFTAGPNPVAKQSGIVNFYRQGKRVSNSELRIYDATGNVINKVKISDKALNSQARRQVGSWDLKDKSGRTVSEGTYLVKGVVKTSDGKGEKVSVIVGVR